MLLDTDWITVNWLQQYSYHRRRSSACGYDLHHASSLSECRAEINWAVEFRAGLVGLLYLNHCLDWCNELVPVQTAFN